MDFFDENYIGYLIDIKKENNTINYFDDLIKIIQPSYFEFINNKNINKDDECSICLNSFIAHKIIFKNKIEKEEENFIFKFIKSNSCPLCRKKLKIIK